MARRQTFAMPALGIVRRLERCFNLQSAFRPFSGTMPQHRPEGDTGCFGDIGKRSVSIRWSVGNGHRRFCPYFRTGGKCNTVALLYVAQECPGAICKLNAVFQRPFNRVAAFCCDTESPNMLFLME